MKKLYVHAAKGKPISLSGSGDVEITIKQVMIDNNIPCEVEDCDFVRGCMTKKNRLLTQDSSEDGKKKWKAYIGKKLKEDAAREKVRLEERRQKLLRVKANENKRGPKAIPVNEPVVKQEAKE